MEHVTEYGESVCREKWGPPKREHSWETVCSEVALAKGLSHHPLCLAETQRRWRTRELYGRKASGGWAQVYRLSLEKLEAASGSWHPTPGDWGVYLTFSGLVLHQRWEPGSWKLAVADPPWLFWADDGRGCGFGFLGWSQLGARVKSLCVHLCLAIVCLYVQSPKTSHLITTPQKFRGFLRHRKAPPSRKNRASEICKM